MKKKYIIFFIVSSSTTFIFGENKPSELSSEKKFIKNNESCTFCRQFVGKSLKNCMDLQDNEGYKANLRNLDAAYYQRKNYLEEILKTQKDYELFLNRFSTEEWELEYRKMTPEEKSI